MSNTLDDLELEFLDKESKNSDLDSSVNIEFTSTITGKDLAKISNSEKTDPEIAQLAKARQQKKAQLRQTEQVELSDPEIGNEQSNNSWPSQKEIELAITKYKVEFIKDLYANFSVTEHKIDRLMKMIYKKNPDTKRELMTIKKQLSDFRKKIA